MARFFEKKNHMTQPIRVIFQGKKPGTFPNLDSAFSFIRSAWPKGRSANDPVIEIKSDPEPGVNNEQTVKTVLHVPAGLFDLSW